MTKIETKSKIGRSVFVLVALLSGIFIGASATAWAFNEFMLKPQAISNARIGVTTKLSVLSELRAGTFDKAVGTLEALLDGDLIGLDALLGGYAIDKETAGVLKRAADYRTKFPRHSTEANVDSHISTLLLRHSSAAEEAQNKP